MKKLLSILAISGIVSSTSTTVIACNKTDSAKLDLSKFNLEIDQLKVKTQILNQIKLQEKTSVKDLTGIEITYTVDDLNNKKISTAPELVITGYKYNITVTIKNNKYFKDGLYTTVIQKDKSNLNMEKFKLNYILDGYVQIRNEIALQAGLSIDDIKNSKTILISIQHEGNGKALLIGGKSYNVTVTILASDLNFNILKTKTVNIIVSKINLDTKKITLMDNSFSKFDGYDQIRKQIAQQARITDSKQIETIKNDNNILISIEHGSNGKSEIEFNKTYTVKITIKDTDQYYDKFSNKIIIIKAIHPILDTSQFIISNDGSVNSYDQIRNEIASQVEGLSVDDIKNSKTIVISILIKDVKLSEDVPIIPGKTYLIKISILNNDKYFNPLPLKNVYITSIAK